MADTRVSLAGITLDNPVIAASGTCGYGAELNRYFDLNLLGGLSFKGTTLSPRAGNPQIRIAECPSGTLNAVGLQNPGAKSVLDKELVEMRRFYRKTVIANICGFSTEEYGELARMFGECEMVDIIEVNISCPNVHGGGMSFGADPKMAALVTSTVKKNTSKPVFIKLTPNVTNITAIARACEDAGADGLSLINTVLGMRIDVRTKKPVLGNTFGGLSGPAIFPIAVRMVYQTAKSVKIPIIGMGGIASAKDVIEMMLAGATAVQVGTAGLVEPLVFKEIIEQLPRLADELGIDRLCDITGGATI